MPGPTGTDTLRPGRQSDKGEGHCLVGCSEAPAARREASGSSGSRADLSGSVEGDQPSGTCSSGALPFLAVPPYLCLEHLVTSEDLHHLLLGGHAHPDVGKGRSIVAQPAAHLYLDGLTGQLCRGGRGGSLWGPLIV